MRINPFAPVKKSIGMPAVDLEYISDYRHIGDNQSLFQLVCEIDSHTERALVAGAIAGYEDRDSWEELNPKETKPEDHLQVPNKGYIALWAENTYYSDEGKNIIWGVYRHDHKVYLVKAFWGQLQEYLKNYGVCWSARFRQGLDACG